MVLRCSILIFLFSLCMKISSGSLLYQLGYKVNPIFLMILFL